MDVGDHCSLTASHLFFGRNLRSKEFRDLHVGTLCQDETLDSSSVFSTAHTLKVDVNSLPQRTAISLPVIFPQAAVQPGSEMHISDLKASHSVTELGASSTVLQSSHFSNLSGYLI